jgi:hypothetical protein
MTLRGLSNGDSVANHLNVFNALVRQFVTIDVSMSKEDHCVTLLCGFLDSWDNMVSTIVGFFHEFLGPCCMRKQEEYPPKETLKMKLSS